MKRKPDFIQESKPDLNYFINRINEFLNQYEIENDCKIIDIKRNVFNHVLIEIYKNVFYPYCKGIPRQIVSRVLPYSDSEMMYRLCDYYIDLCYKYNKSITIYGYAYMMGISNLTIYKWDSGINRDTIYIDTNNYNREILLKDIEKYKKIYVDSNIVELPNTLLGTIAKKLRSASENNLAEMAVDGSVMALAMGKIKHGWEEGRKAQAQARILETYTSPQELLKDYSKNDKTSTIE